MIYIVILGYMICNVIWHKSNNLLSFSQYGMTSEVTFVILTVIYDKRSHFVVITVTYDK